MFGGKTLLITGGTGTFGNAMIRRFLDSDLKEIKVFSRDEKKQEDLRILYNHPKLTFIVGDVRDIDSCHDAVQGVDYIFHAAALKQVPACEFYPMEALQTNALGAENIMRAAAGAGVGKVVLLSTDKAAYPANAMGISKAMMEKLMIARARVSKAKGVTMCATRYGNIMGSRGSVIPLFIRQIMTGQPITLTDQHMTRFMMTIEDAIELVLFAFDQAQPGDIFVKKAVSICMGDLAEAVKKVFNSNCPIEVIGARHGEKYYETLLTREEMGAAIDCGNYFRVPTDSRGMNYYASGTTNGPHINGFDDYHSSGTSRLCIDQMAELLMKLEVVQQALKGVMPD
jgi:UDP-glucose 4-epimerase